MLVNCTKKNSASWEQNKKSILEKKYGAIIDIKIPAEYDNFEKTAEHYFYRISACFDSCANEPKENVVLISSKTDLEKEIKRLLEISSIRVFDKEIIN